MASNDEVLPHNTSRFFGALQNMRRDGKLCDANISVQNVPFVAHRFVLSATIPFFRAMFGSSMKESYQREIQLDGIVDPCAMELMIDFAYGNTVDIATKNVQSLLLASDFLQVDDVKEACCRFMSSRLSPENVPEIRNLAESLNCLSLVQKCRSYTPKTATNSFQGMDLKDQYPVSVNISACFTVLQSMRQNGELCDIRISVRNVSFVAHRVILLAAIPYFGDIFGETLTGDEPFEVLVDGIDPDGMQRMIDFVYGKAVKVTTENVQSLFRESAFLQINEVKNACIRFMVSRFSPENVLEVKSFAESLNCLSLVEECQCYIAKNFNHPFLAEFFFRMPLSVIKNIICREDIQANYSERAFEVVIAWIKASNVKKEDREHMLYELFSNIPLKMLNIDYLLDVVSTEDLIQNSGPCRDLLKRAEPRRSHEEAEEESFFMEGMSYKLFDTPVILSSSGIYQNWGYGVHAICYSESFGIYIRRYDTRNTKWMTYSNRVPYSYSSTICSVFSENTKIFFVGEARILSTDVNSYWLDTFPIDCLYPYKTPVLHFSKIYFLKYKPLDHNKVHDPCEITCSSRYSKCISVGRKKSSFYDFSAVSLSQYIYIIGGCSESQCLNTVERYEPITRQWIQSPTMLTARTKHSATVHNGKIYVCGGLNNLREPVNTVEVYSTMSDQWSYVSLMKLRGPSFSLASGITELFFLHRTESCGRKYRLETYNPQICRWKDSVLLRVWEDDTQVKIVCVKPRG